MKYVVRKSFIPANSDKNIYSVAAPGKYEVIDIIDGKGVRVNFLYMYEYINNREIEQYGRLIES